MMKPDIVVSIITGSDPAATISCLNSIFSQDCVNYVVKVWVINNQSGSDLDCQIKLRFPDVNLISNQYRQGFAANHNQVLSQADARYMLILNDDTQLQPGSLDVLIENADRQLEAGLIGPLLLNPDGTVQQSIYKVPSVALEAQESFGSNWLQILGSKMKASPSIESLAAGGNKQVEALSGAALMIRKEALDEIGVLDERFFMYAEDLDWCLRASQKGWQVLFVPAARVMHVGGSSSANRRAERSVEFLRSHELFVEKHYGKAALQIYKIFALIKHAPRALLCGLISSRAEQFLEQRDAVLWSLGKLNRPGLADLCKEYNNSLTQE